jgi:peptide/nickel transport system permease protein
MLWVVVTLVFLGLRLQGDPMQLMLGFEATPEADEAMREKLGLSDSVTIQFARCARLVAGGDFGDSIRERRPVTEAVFDRLPATFQLAVAALASSILVGVPLGVVAARHRNSPLDRGLMAFAFFGQSAPNFLVSILHILTVSPWLTWRLKGGRRDIKHLVMPAVTLSTAGTTSLVRLTRTARAAVD